MAHDTLYAIGEALIDMIPAETGCDFGAVSSFAPRVGGAPANVAAAFARLGGRSALLARVGGVLLYQLAHRLGVAGGLCTLGFAQHAVVDDHVAKQIGEHRNGAENAHREIPPFG